MGNTKNMIQPKPEFIKDLKEKKRNTIMLALGSILGVLASMVATIIENFFVGNEKYSLVYSLIVILCFVLTLFFLINIYWRWKLLLLIYRQKRLLKKYKKIKENLKNQ